MAESLAKGNNPPSEDFLSFPDGGTERTRKLREAYQQLKDFYASLSASSVRLRYAPSAVCFVNLAIREGNPSKDKVDVSNFLQATIHGLDQYCSQISKKNIKYKTILTCSGPGVDSGRRYIFSGSPGCGKTTLAHKLTQDLYSEHLSNSYKLILFVELRKLRLYLIQSEGSIGLPLVLKVLGLPEGLSTAIEEQGGEGVALILDGFDEISDDVKMSFWLTHLFSRETLYLNRCDMFVTTRSSQLAKLTDKCREHRTLIEILGFTKKNINSYIRKYPFHSPHKSEEVIQKLESLPLIRGMCSNPRILEILCKLHQHVQEEPLPETLSGTFAKLICHQLEEDLNQRQPPVKVRIRNLLEVPEDLFPGFYQLCEVAYKCCLEQRLIITVEDLGALKQYEDSRGSIYNLLFSEEVESCSPVDGVLYQSDHKTILETLAAAYIGHLRPIREQEGFLKVVLKASHMALVWRMYCGVTGLKFVDIKAVYPLSGRARDVLQTGHVLLGSMDTYITTFDKHDMLLMLSLYEANDRDSANQVLCDILRNFVAVRIDDGYKSAVVTHTISCHPQLERVLLLIEAEWIDSWALKPLIACLAKVKSVALLIPPIEIVLALLSGRVQELWVDWFRMHISNMKVGDLGRNKFPTPKDWRSLADGVKSSSCLQSLRINFPGLPDIDPDACRYVVENISRNKNVAKITIDSPANIPVTENCLQKLFKDRRSVTLNFPIPLVLWSVMLPELKKAKTLNELGLRVVRHKASDMFSNKLRLQTLKGIIMKNKNINHLAITCGDAEDYLQVLKLLSSPSCKHIKGLHLAGTIDVKDIANGHELCDLLLAGPMLRHTCHLCLRLDAVECGLLLSRVHTLKPLEELSIFVTIQSCNSTHKDSTLREVKTSIAKCNLKKLKIEYRLGITSENALYEAVFAGVLSNPHEMDVVIHGLHLDLDAMALLPHFPFKCEMEVFQGSHFPHIFIFPCQNTAHGSACSSLVLTSPSNNKSFPTSQAQKKSLPPKSYVEGLKGKPSQKELNRISKKAGDNWRSLLTELGLEQATIEAFLLSKIGDTSEACFKGLAYWLDSNADKPVTWETLLKAMRDSHMVEAARDLEEEIINGEEVVQQPQSTSPKSLEHQHLVLDNEDIQQPHSSKSSPRSPKHRRQVLSNPKDFMEHFRVEFLAEGVVDGQMIAEKLVNEHVIPESLKNKLAKEDSEYDVASAILNHMKKQSDYESLESLCTIMMNEGGMKRMNKLGKKMLDSLIANKDNFCESF